MKEIDYDLPSSQTAAITMTYDNALRVSHAEATMPGSTTSFLLKADYTYAADGRVMAKDDLLDDKWDRTNKYDFAGRLTFNQFGDGMGSDLRSCVYRGSDHNWGTRLRYGLFVFWQNV